MSLNAISALHPRECPVCSDAFDIDVHLPKVFGCGHSVCATCVPVCMIRCATCGGYHLAKCPLCRQQTSTSEDGLPTNFDLRDMIDSMRIGSNVETVACTDCTECVPSSKAFVCRTCSTSDKIVVCGFCAIKTHRQHDLVDNDKPSTTADTDEAASKDGGGLDAVASSCSGNNESAEDTQTSNFFAPTAAIVNDANVVSERPVSSSTTASLSEVYATLQSNLAQLKEINKKLHGLQEHDG